MFSVNKSQTKRFAMGNTRRHLRWALLLLLGLVLGLVSCEDMGEPPPRLILGHSADGAKLKDPYARTLGAFGKPNSFGPADGTNGWWALDYDKGPHAGVRLYFVDAQPDSPGQDSLDIIVVFGPYTGKTREGLGIGSQRSEVLKALGPPVRSASLTPPESVDVFDVHGVKVEIYYVNNRIDGLSMGPVFPPL